MTLLGEDLFELMFENNSAVMLLIDPSDGAIVRANLAAEWFYGYPRAVLKTMNIADINQLTKAEIRGAMDRALRTQGNCFVFPHRLASKEVRMVEVYSSRITLGKRDLLFSIIHDVTERLRAEAALRESEEFYRHQFDACPVAVVLFLPEGMIVGANAAACHIFGRPEEELIEIGWEGLTADSEPFRFMVTEGPARTAFLQEELTFVRKDGSTFPGEATCITLRTSSGSERCEVFIRDLTERKRSEEALRLSQMDMSHAQAVARTGSWRLNVGRNELQWSEETYRIFGIPVASPMTYEHFLAIVHHEDKESVSRAWKEALLGAPYDIEHRIVVGEEVKWVHERADLEFDRHGLLLSGFGTVQDITDRKRGEEERDRLLYELADAFARIKTLSGMLPICSGCKKIRDDKGYWNQLEAYITAHSEALFSHGLCPECLGKAYGELEKLKRGKGSP